MAITPIASEIDLTPPDHYEDLQIWLYNNFKLIQLLLGSFGVANSLSLVSGTSPDVLADLQVFNDGNTYLVTEVGGGGDGMDLQVTFDGLETIQGLAFNGSYNGSSAHNVQIQLFNNLTSLWDTVINLSNNALINYRFIRFPNNLVHLDANGSAIVRFWHPAPSTPGHVLTIDYIGVIH